jgi:predicted DNA-binding WGR domain protein
VLYEYTTQALEGRFTPNEKITERIDLHYNKGSSDKVYIIITTINLVTLTYSVTGFYGRRGAGLTVDGKGTFTSHDDAIRKATSIMNEKMKKGYYKVGSQNTASAGTIPQAQPTPKNMPVGDLTDTAPTYSIGVVNKETSAKKIENILKNDNLIIEPFSLFQNDPFYFVRMYWNSNIQDKGWYVYRTDGTQAFVESEVPEDVNIAWGQRDTIFLAYRSPNNNLAFFDVYHLGETGKPVQNEQWKARRAMLTVAFGNLFPSRKDLYDTSFFAHINNYIYEDKDVWVQNHPGLYIARDINGTHKKSAVAFTV